MNRVKNVGVVWMLNQIDEWCKKRTRGEKNSLACKIFGSGAALAMTFLSQNNFC